MFASGDLGVQRRFNPKLFRNFDHQIFELPLFIP
jgi:hypothetical protein